MGLPTLLLMLLPLPPPASPQTVGSEDCKEPGARVDQPAHLSVPEGGSVSIPFSFHCSWELAVNPQVNIAWGRKDLSHQYIYDKDKNFTHQAFCHRLSLHWHPGWRNGSLQLRDLRSEDTTTYYCWVSVSTLRCGRHSWKSVRGTRLTVTSAHNATTEDAAIPTSPPRVPGDSVSSEHRSSRPGPMNMEVVTGVAMVSLKASILGLAVCLRWKRS